MAILDTTFLIALEQREKGAKKWLNEHRYDEHFVPDFVIVEFLTGHTEADEALDLLDASFTIAHGDLDWVRSSASLRTVLRKKKVRFRAPDFWIAAWAHHLQTAVVTRNLDHFKDFNVPVETW